MKFIQRSCQFQEESISKEEAQKNFSISCDVCSNKGINIICEKCPIKRTHQLVMSVFADIEQIEEEKARKSATERK